MKALVVGGGSIGSRHLRNLKKLGVEHLALVETDPARRDAVAAELSLTGFPSLDEGLAWAPDFVVVASPTYLHAEQTLQIVGRGCSVFVEKPLSHTAAGIAELADMVEKKKLTSLVGCNMRFHPGPAKVKALLDEGVLGKILFARVYTGFYLPEWRPKTDYRQNYAARVETGGGCLMDCIHEIDLARWYLGEMQSVFCCAGHLSSLEIETEDVAVLVCRHASGAISEIHLDYVQRTYERGCQIVGELGSIFWDFNNKAVRWYNAGSKEWTTYSQPESWEVNQMYVDEMKHFLECMEQKRPTTLSIPVAAALMQAVFAAKVSSEQGKMVAVAGVVK
ncbi:MAG: Gfo/Idh/MocA family protein [Candidatus Sulfotelmatobacter sp.]